MLLCMPLTNKVSSSSSSTYRARGLCHSASIVSTPGVIDVPLSVYCFLIVTVVFRWSSCQVTGV